MQNRHTAATFLQEAGFADPMPPRTGNGAYITHAPIGSSVGFAVAGSLAEILFTRQFGKAPPKVVLLDSICS
jgi:hypothetical protein